MSESTGKKPERRGAITAIAVFKIVKSVLLLLVALGAVKFSEHGSRTSLEHWLAAWRHETGEKYARMLLAQISQIDERRVEVLGVATFLYAAIFMTEGVGLLLRKRWAEYLTVIATGSFLPIEVYELVHHFSAPKVLTLVVNAAVVVYLLVRLWRDRHQDKDHQDAKEPAT